MCERFCNPIFTIPNLLTRPECDRYIELSEYMGYQANPQQENIEIPKKRDSDQVLMKDQDHAAKIWSLVEKRIPSEHRNMQAIGVNELIRFYRYGPNQKFQPHHDNPYCRGNGEQSLLTLIIYLNDGFCGGETTFFLGEEKKPLYICPEKGTGLLFEHSLLHEGCTVEDGTKYVLRTDIMYRPLCLAGL